MKKAQVTIFIIIGIVILITFFVIYSFSSRLTIEQKQTFRVAQSKLDSAVVNQYVTTCLKNALEEGVVLIANQGGRIYSTQNGSVLGCNARDCTPAGSISSFEQADVGYSLVMHPEVSPLPEYPYYVFEYNVSSHYPLTVLGLGTLPELSGTSDSIQAQLEEYIAYHTVQCIDFSKVGISALPFNLDIDAANVEVNLEIQTEDIRAEMELPVVINIDGNSQTEIQHFTVSSPIRLYYLYNFVKDVNHRDSTDLGFNPAVDYTKTTWYHSGMKLEANYNQKVFDDLFVVTDNKSLIKDEPLKFFFARQNLPPVLNYIHTKIYNKDHDVILMVPDQGATLMLEFFALDPNEDFLSYDYSGWKVDYDEKNLGPGQGIQKTGLLQPIMQVSGNRITIPLNRTDAGEHILNVSVSDGRYTDYQEIKILIDDKVKVVAEGENPYADIPNNYASVEDPYRLAALTTDEFNTGTNDFEWDDSAEGVLYEGQEPIFWLPGPSDYSTLQYENIDITNVDNPFNTAPALHNIRVKVDTGVQMEGIETTDQDVLEVQVMPCLPHRSNSPAYPYHTTQDPFQANHSCCLGNINEPSTWQIASTTHICYNSTSNSTGVIVGTIRKCDGIRGNVCLGEITESTIS